MDPQPETPPLKLVLEALLFSSQKPLTPRELRDLLNLAAQDESATEAAPHRRTREEAIEQALAELDADHAAAGRSYQLTSGPAGWHFATRPAYGAWLRALLGKKARPPRLTQPGIETLTIIAYRQPVTRTEIEQIRGVSVDGVMQTLLERGLIEAVGRAEVVGRPVTYGTTPAFLEYFGVRSLEDLPAADELRRLAIQKPDSLLTVDPGLTTTPPETPAPAEGASTADGPPTNPSETPAPEGMDTGETPASSPTPPATDSTP